MIDPLDEHAQMLTLPQAAAICPKRGRKRPHVATLWRWSAQGVNGVHLKCFRIGRRIMTTPDALRQFFSDLDVAAKTGKLNTTFVAKARTQTRRQQDIDAAWQSMKSHRIFKPGSKE